MSGYGRPGYLRLGYGEDVAEVGGSGSFAADACIGWTQTAVWTADAVIRLESHFTADARIAGHISAKAVIKTQHAGSFIANAKHRARRVGSLTANSRIAGGLTADARIGVWFSADAVLHTSTEARATQAVAEVVVRPTPAARVTQVVVEVIYYPLAHYLTADAAFWAPGSRTGSLAAHAVIKAQRVGSFVIDARSFQPGAGSFSTDAYVAHGFRADAVLQAGSTRTLTANAALSVPRTKAFATDARFANTRFPTITGNSWLLRRQTYTVTATAVVKGHPTAGFAADALISAPWVRLTFGLPAHALVHPYFTANAVKSRRPTKSFTANANSAWWHSGSIPANALIVPLRVTGPRRIWHFEFIEDIRIEVGFVRAEPVIVYGCDISVPPGADRVEATWDIWLSGYQPDQNSANAEFLEFNRDGQALLTQEGATWTPDDSTGESYRMRGSFADGPLIGGPGTRYNLTLTKRPDNLAPSYVYSAYRSFTVDAIWLYGNLTADAFLIRDKLFADAVIGKDILFANAVIEAPSSEPSSLSADAFFSPFVWTFAADALIHPSLEADAVVFRNDPRSFWSAAWVINYPNPLPGPAPLPEDLNGGGADGGTVRRWLAGNPHPMAPTSRGFETYIFIDGEDVGRDNVVWSTARFSSTIGDSPGTCYFEIRDPFDRFSYTGGEEIKLLIDGQWYWGGFIVRISHSLWFPGSAAKYTDNRSGKSYSHVLKYMIEGMDYNMIFDRRVANHKNWLDFEGENGSFYKAYLKNEAFDPAPRGAPESEVVALALEHFDLNDLYRKGFDRGTYVTSSRSPDEDNPIIVAEPGDTMRTMLNSHSMMTNSVHFIDTDFKLHVQDRSEVNVRVDDTTWNPEWREKVRGFRDISTRLDAGPFFNEALVFGTLIEPKVYSNATSGYGSESNRFGRWQHAEWSHSRYTVKSNDARAQMLIDRLGKPLQTSQMTTFEPGFHPGSKRNDMILQGTNITWENPWVPRWALSYGVAPNEVPQFVDVYSATVLDPKSAPPTGESNFGGIGALNFSLDYPGSASDYAGGLIVPDSPGYGRDVAKHDSKTTPDPSGKGSQASVSAATKPGHADPHTADTVGSARGSNLDPANRGQTTGGVDSPQGEIYGRGPSLVLNWNEFAPFNDGIGTRNSWNTHRSLSDDHEPVQKYFVYPGAAFPVPGITVANCKFVLREEYLWHYASQGWEGHNWGCGWYAQLMGSFMLPTSKIVWACTTFGHQNCDIGTRFVYDGPLPSLTPIAVDAPGCKGIAYDVYIPFTDKLFPKGSIQQHWSDRQIDWLAEGSWGEYQRNQYGGHALPFWVLDYYDFDWNDLFSGKGIQLTGQGISVGWIYRQLWSAGRWDCFTCQLPSFGGGWFKQKEYLVLDPDENAETAAAMGAVQFMVKAKTAFNLRLRVRYRAGNFSGMFQARQIRSEGRPAMNFRFDALTQLMTEQKKKDYKEHVDPVTGLLVPAKKWDKYFFWDALPGIQFFTSHNLLQMELEVGGRPRDKDLGPLYYANGTVIGRTKKITPWKTDYIPVEIQDPDFPDDPKKTITTWVEDWDVVYIDFPPKVVKAIDWEQQLIIRADMDTFGDEVDSLPSNHYGGDNGPLSFYVPLAGTWEGNQGWGDHHPNDFGWEEGIRSCLFGETFDLYTFPEYNARIEITLEVGVGGAWPT